MQLTFHLNLCDSLDPVVGDVKPGEHGVLPGPSGECDTKRGLKFPLESGGLLFASGRLINDEAGSLEIVFSPSTDSPDGDLIQAWGVYRMLYIADHILRLDVYGTHVDVTVPWQGGVEHTITMSWDCRVGVTISVKQEEHTVQCRRQRLTWRAFRQSFAPFSIGGVGQGHRFKQWAGAFDGWIRSVKVWDTPMETPGPTELIVNEEKVPPPFDSMPGIALLELDSPTIKPDPLGLIQLPDRPLKDLHKTREVAGLDDVLVYCKNELEVFTRLTSWMANLWPHCSYWPFPRNQSRFIFWQRGHEMIPEIKAGRMGGMCGGYAHVMEEVFWSLGFDARRIQVSGHSSFEAYSNQLDKWIICDASYNRDCYFLSDPAGTLLGCGDLIRRHEALEHDPNALNEVAVLNCHDENLVPGSVVQLPDSEGGPGRLYDHIGLSVDKTSEFGRNESTTGTAKFAWYFRDADLAKFDEDNMGCGGGGNVRVDNLEDLYPSRNRVAPTFSWQQPGKVLDLKLEHVGVTFFDTFLLQVGDAPEEPVTDRYSWHLRPGINRLAVRTRNKLGAKGYPFMVTLWKQADK